MIKRKRNKSNLVTDGIKLTLPCKNWGLCIKNPRTMADVICTGCEKNFNLGDKND
jgi:tRNA splicing ligase